MVYITTSEDQLMSLKSQLWTETGIKFSTNISLMPKEYFKAKMVSFHCNKWRDNHMYHTIHLINWERMCHMFQVLLLKIYLWSSKSTGSQMSMWNQIKHMKLPYSNRILHSSLNSLLKLTKPWTPQLILVKFWEIPTTLYQRCIENFLQRMLLKLHYLHSLDKTHLLTSSRDLGQL